MRSRGIRIAAAIGLVGRLCVPLAAQDTVTKAHIAEAVGARIAEGARGLSRSFREVLFGYCAASWEGEWLQLCERHNELLSDLQRERRLTFDEIEFRYANEVPDAVRARCESDAPGHVGELDPACLRAEVDRERDREMRDLRARFTERWADSLRRFTRECGRLIRRYRGAVPDELPWSCQ